MCGILGWIHPRLHDAASTRQCAQPALDALKSRGPDASSLSTGDGWLMGHTRLAILDLTPNGEQPMTDGRGHWLVFNGEVYNFRELRAELEGRGCTFKSTGDSEVVLHAMRVWGTDCLSRLRGMFAFGWLDERERRLILARDRYGVKPLAYESRSKEFRFGSDLFTLRMLPHVANEIDSEAVYLYLGYGYVPAPLSILRGVRKVRPGCFLEVRWDDPDKISLSERVYWSINSVPQQQDEKPERLQIDYEARVHQAVRYRLISDRAVGSLLSGGIDSTLVTAVCAEELNSEIPSFTMGFNEPTMDEAPFARAIAEKLCLRHKEFYATALEVVGVCAQIPHVYDEPFADPSALPMILLCQYVVESVTVALCGDGGDEALCGYPWHRALDRVERWRAVPWWLRRSAQLAAVMSATALYQSIVFGAREREDQWAALRTGLSPTMTRHLPVTEADAFPNFGEYVRQWSSELRDVRDPLDWACRIDLLTYLPDDLMVKADRASMSVGLELREPLLDHELTAWCLQLPTFQRFDRSTRTGKLPARAALAQRLPREMFERPKQGFTPPLHAWLRGPLRGLVETTLSRLARGELPPLCLPDSCRTWEECASRLNDRFDAFLWRVICFAQWLDHHREIGRGRAQKTEINRPVTLSRNSGEALL
jgi:asparagine synthase (glutamine-hydrolysing)